MPKTKKTETLTDDQLQTLAIALRRYGGNVFTVAQSKFGVEVGDSKWPSYRFAIPGKEYKGFWYGSKEKALSKCPRFDRSLDACAPLLDEMGYYEIRCDTGMEDGVGVVREYTVSLYHETGITVTVENSLPRAICIAYILWKQEQA